MKIFYVIVLSIFFISAAEKDINFGHAYVDKVNSIYDGDTFRCDIKGFRKIIGKNIGIRVANIDCPEMTDKRPEIKAKAQEAKQFAVKMLREGKRIRLKNLHRGKYFRIVADVIIDGKNLGDELINAGLAKRYDGGTKEKW
jgi:endonuclease YncB( thermonuclease family)